MGQQIFRVHVTKDYLKFSAAHFIAYHGFRESLHGHNYRISVEIEGDLGSQGYVLDFGIVEQVAKRVCQRLDEKFIVPAQSDCLHIREESGQMTLRYEDDEFHFPVKDVVVLPIVHSSAEELARYLAAEIRQELVSAGAAGLRVLEVGVEERPGETAYVRESL